MADNIDTAFLALHARLDEALAQTQRDLSRLVGSVETPSQRLEALRDVVRDIGATVEDLQAHIDQAARPIGYDGNDDVRISREDGPALGSLAAVQADLQLDANRARESDDENPSVLDRIERLQQRLGEVSRDMGQSQGMER